MFNIKLQTVGQADPKPSLQLGKRQPTARVSKCLICLFANHLMLFSQRVNLLHLPPWERCPSALNTWRILIGEARATEIIRATKKVNSHIRTRAANRQWLRLGACGARKALNKRWICLNLMIRRKMKRSDSSKRNLSKEASLKCRTRMISPLPIDWSWRCTTFMYHTTQTSTLHAIWALAKEATKLSWSTNWKIFASSRHSLSQEQVAKTSMARLTRFARIASVRSLSKSAS